MTIRDYKKYFEANLLDGQEIHTTAKSTMISAQHAYEVIGEYVDQLEKLIQKEVVAELKKVEVWHGGELGYFNGENHISLEDRIKELGDSKDE